MKGLLFLLFLCGAVSLSAQTFNVRSVKPLQVEEAYTGLKFDNAGNKLLLSSGVNGGLMMYNLQSNTFKQLFGEGIDVRNAVFSSDDTTVFFSKNKRINNRLFKDLYAFDLKQGKETLLEGDIRDLTPPVIRGNELLYAKDSQLKRVPQVESKQVSKISKDVYVAIENQKLALYRDGLRTELDPCGDGSYIWPSISPDGKSLLFYEVRKGTHIYNLNSGETVFVGKIQAPAWVDNNWIAGMETTDDGHEILSGAVFVIDSKGGNKQYVSPQTEVCLYPSVAIDGHKLAFTTAKGKVYIVDYIIK